MFIFRRKGAAGEGQQEDRRGGRTPKNERQGSTTFDCAKVINHQRPSIQAAGAHHPQQHKGIPAMVGPQVATSLTTGRGAQGIIGITDDRRTTNVAISSEGASRALGGSAERRTPTDQQRSYLPACAQLTEAAA